MGVDVICGIRVPVVRATAEQATELTDADGDPNDGFYCGKTATIFLRKGNSPTQERDTLNHERCHAFLALSGLQNLLTATVQWPQGYDDFEELVVRIAAPHLCTMDLQSLTTEMAQCVE